MIRRVVFYICVLVAAFHAGAGNVFSLPAGEEQEALVRSWGSGLGDTEHSILAFRFEVTFMKIDVADIEARLATAQSTTLAKLAFEGKATEERREEAAAILLAADTIAFRLIFLRGGGYDKFLKGTRKNLEKAREAEVISEIEFDSVWTEYQRIFDTLDERGSHEGDQLMYRVQNDELRLIYLGAEGDVLVDTTYSSEGWARGIKGSFLVQDTAFQEELILSLWED